MNHSQIKIKPWTLVLLLFLVLPKGTYSQSSLKDIKVGWYEYTAMLPVVLKEGKAPKIKEVVLTSYILTYAKSAYQSSKWLSVGRFIETYKGKTIKEVLYDTELLETRGFNKSDINDRMIFDYIVDTKTSTLDFEALCCGFDTYSDSPVYKKDAGFKPTGTNRNRDLRMQVKAEFFQSISDEIFLDRIKESEKFSKEATEELLKLKKYVDDKYGLYAKYESDAKLLESSNTELRRQLRNYIPNVYGRNDPTVRVANYAHEGAHIQYLKEGYMYDPYGSSSLRSRYRGHLLIEYPEGSPYEGKVYMRQIKSDRNGNNRIMEVYKQDTKQAIPFKQLMIYGYAGFEIYGIQGTFDKDSTFLTQEERNSFDDVIKPSQLASDVVRKYENEEFKNYYLKREIPFRQEELLALQKSIAVANARSKRQATFNYEVEKKESFNENGFFLETRDLKDETDNDIDYRLDLIYKGEFNEQGYININGYSTKAFEELVLQGIVHAVMSENSKNCGNELAPEQKAEIYEDVCKAETVETNQWGREVDRYCSDWTQKPTGRFTSKRIYEAFTKQKRQTSSLGGLANALKLVADPGKAFRARQYIDELTMDIRKIYRLNSCDSKALARFEENLVKYVLGQKSLAVK